MPGPDKAILEEWLPFVLKNAKISKDTVLIGHSSGCPLILSILQNSDVQIKQAILVAGFIDGSCDAILQKKYNWEKIKRNVKDLVFINSDNDPWGCDDKQGLKMFYHLGGTLILRHGEGHMGSDKFNQPYKEFPLLLKLIKVS